MQGAIPTISVVIPAYDREATISRTLDSLIQQTHEGWEAIVVDDGSRDKTAEVAEGYARADERFRVHRQKNGGVGAARNAGISLAGLPWLFFLDADDWIIPTALASLYGASTRHGDRIDAVHAGYVRVDEKGRETRERRPHPDEELFPIFTRMCAFAIHACLIRTDLVRLVGGFDETLVTCEDWDLWQRVARTGAKFVAIPDYIAYYGMRSGSASANGARMLDDGLRVIKRGHLEDSRLTTAHPAYRQGAPASAEPLAQAYFACYTAGLVMSDGGDARWMLDALDARPADLDADGVAETLFLAVPNGRAAAPGDWPSFPPEVLERCREFITAIGEWMHDSWLGYQARRSLERLILEASDGAKPRTVGPWHLVEVDCCAHPPAQISAGQGVDHVLCTVRCGSREIGTLELAACDGWVPPRVLADGIAEKFAWEILRVWLTRSVYSTLEIDRDGASARVSRFGTLLFEGDVPSDYPFEQWLHDRVGWNLLLQEIWDRPAWVSDQFYSQEHEPRTESQVQATSSPVSVEITSQLPLIRCEADSAAIGVTLAGVPLVTLRVAADRGRIQPHEIRRTALLRLGFEFCRAVIRELILAPAAETELSLRDVLQMAAAKRALISETTPVWAEGSEPRPLVAGWQHGLAELLPPGGGGTVIGRRATGADGTGVSRYVVLPTGSQAEMVAGALHNGDPILELGDADSPTCVAYAPCLQWDRSSGAFTDAEDESLIAHLEFEQTFAARSDPWHYSSDYERLKYDQTLSLIPDGVQRVLEIGCAEGIFTARLSERVPSVLACDISTVALSRAARRCSNFSNVTFMCLDLFRDELPEGNDLIVCSETLYYAASRERLARAIERFARALSPKGFLLTANAHVLVDEKASSGFDWDIPFGAKRIAETVLTSGSFDLVEETRTDPYRIQLYSRRHRRRVLPTRLRSRDIKVKIAGAGEMPAEVAARYFPDGGEVRVEEVAPAILPDPKLPILMYHRIASEGSPLTARWRIHPDDFERQLEFLRAEGYYSVTFEQWRAAANMRRRLPGKPIILTFDDGYADFPREVSPALRRHGFGAIVFVVSELVGQSNVWDSALGESLPLMGWDVIKGLAGEGIDFGSHTARHRPLVMLTQTQMADDLARSRRILEERLGHTVTSVSYPFGLRDTTVESVAGSCGYEYGVTTDEWPASWSDSLIALPRLEVRGTHTLEDFVTMLRS